MTGCILVQLLFTQGPMAHIDSFTQQKNLASESLTYFIQLIAKQAAKLRVQYLRNVKRYSKEVETMIDTVKIQVTLPAPLKSPRIKFNQPTYFPSYDGPIKAYLNTSKSDKKIGAYHPSFTYYQNPDHIKGPKYCINLEVSLPKLINGNNFVELDNDSLEEIVRRLVLELERIGVVITKKQILESEIVKIDFAKNIIFKDYTSPSSLIKYFESADISKVYTPQRTNYRGGGRVGHFQNNCEDIVLYDKISDLQSGIKSDSHAQEQDNYIQKDLLDSLKARPGLMVARFEVRLNGKRKIRLTLRQAGLHSTGLTIKDLFKVDVARAVLLYKWHLIVDHIPASTLLTSSPDLLFTQIIKDPDINLRSAIEVFFMAQILSSSDNRHVRNMIEDRFGKYAWSKLKDSRGPPTIGLIESLSDAGKQIENMKPAVYEDLFERC